MKTKTFSFTVKTAPVATKRNAFKCSFTVLCALMVFSLSAQTIRYVKQGGAGSGSSWADASGNLQAMINASVATNEVWVAAGTYQPAAGQYFYLKNGVKIYGGFPASGNPDFTNRDWTANTTILKANGNRAVNSGAGITATAGIDGFTITNGSGPTLQGGGMYITGSPGLSNLLITANTAWDGGGIYFHSSTSQLTNVTISSNTANGNGGGIYAKYSILSGTGINILSNNSTYGAGIFGEYVNTFTNFTIENNTAAEGGGGIADLNGITLNNCTVRSNNALNGGGIYIMPLSTLKISNSIVNLNTAQGNGGGIASNNPSGAGQFLTTISDTAISGNKAINGLGGGIYTPHSSNKTVMTDVIVSDNESNLDGGGIYINSTLTFTRVNIRQNRINGTGSGGGIYILPGNNTTFTGVSLVSNVATQNAGGLYLGGGSNTILQNVLITSNTAVQDGGGILSTGGGTFRNCTIVSNLAQGLGSGFYFAPSATIYPLNFNNCIIYNNSVATLGTSYFPTFQNSLIAGSGGSSAWNATLGTNGGSNIDTDPLFTNEAGNDFTLIPGSPAFNTGAKTLYPMYSTAVDLAGNTRVFYSEIDMGCYELQSVPQIRYVRQGGTGNGLSWANASGSIQAMINASVATNQVWVAAGEYLPPADRSFLMKEGVKIYGGFPTIGNPAMADRDWDTNITILKGNGAQVIINSNITQAAILDGFTITGGTVANGSGIYNQNASPVLANLIVRNNTSNGLGGGIFNADSNPLMTNITIRNNTAALLGGGMYNQNSNPVLTNVTIRDNAAATGGGIYNNTASPALSNVIIENNTATGHGGGIFNTDSSPVLTDVKISNNSAIGNGGGIYSQGTSTPILNHLTISNNVATSGGGMFNGGSSPKLSNVVIKSNTATVNGGGIYSQSNSVSLLTNVTITNNIAPDGAGMLNLSSSAPQIKNTIIWGNKKPNNAVSNIANYTGAAPAYINSLVQGSSGSTGWDPLFGTDGGNNIDMDPLFTDAVNSNYSLTPCSIAINAGDTSFIAAATDLSGNPRISDTAVDMGAYEFQGPADCTICAYTAKWNGTSWSTPPTARTILEFNGNFSSTGDITGCAIKVNSGNVVINSGHTVTINKNIDATAGKFTLEDTASLTQLEDAAVNSGTYFTMKRNTMPMYRYDYTYWSSPVTPQTLYNLSPLTLGDKFFGWDTATQNWFGYPNGNHTMELGKGYIVRAPNSFSINPSVKTIFNAAFNGTPNNGVITVPVMGSNNLNLLGNPYPSAISANAFLLANASTVDGTIYLWTHNTPIAAGGTGYIYTADDYACFNFMGGTGTAPAENTGVNNSIPSGSIAAGQGFFIKGRNSGGQAFFNNSMRMPANNNQFFRTAESVSGGAIEKHRLWLNIANDSGAFKQALVGYAQTATDAFDWGLDGEMNTAGGVALYSFTEDKLLSIQGRPLPFNISDIVPMGYTSNISGTFTISIDHFDGLFESQDIFLKDKLLNIIHDLKESAYSFVTEPGTFDERFEIIYEDDTTLGANNFQAVGNNIIAYHSGNAVIVASDQKELKSVTIFDIGGRKIGDANNINANTVRLNNFHIQSGMLILKIITADDGVLIKKIFIGQY